DAQRSADPRHRIRRQRARGRVARRAGNRRLRHIRGRRASRAPRRRPGRRQRRHRRHHPPPRRGRHPHLPPRAGARIARAPIPGDHVPIGGSSMTSLALTYAPRARRPFFPLVRAELLKLRRNRGILFTSAALTIGTMVVAFGVVEILHLANPAHHGPAGGVKNLGDSATTLALIGSVAAVLIGAAAGAGDLGSGVFRELVVTGRSRLALFAARIPGGLGLLVPLVVIAFGIEAAATVGLAGSLAAPSAALLAKTAVWIL